mgnify:CR=1 FL=1
MKNNGKLNFVCWSKLEDNDFFVMPLKIVLRHLNKPLPTPSKSPGPLSFSDPDHTEHILKSSGFKSVAIKTVKTKMINYDTIENQIQLFKIKFAYFRLNSKSPASHFGLTFPFPSENLKLEILFSRNQIYLFKIKFK